MSLAGVEGAGENESPLSSSVSSSGVNAIVLRLCIAMLGVW